MPILVRVGKSGVRLVHGTGALNRGPLVFPGWYPRDHKPNVYPRNEEERRAAAIKYGLRPEDYKPIDPDNVCWHAGDYPDLGLVTYDNKDPYEFYTDRMNRRNWGEQVIMPFMKHRADRNSYNGLDSEDFTIPRFLYMMSLILVPMFIFMKVGSSAAPEVFRIKNPQMPKQYHWDYYPTFPFGDPCQYPITNYTFEPAEE